MKGEFTLTFTFTTREIERKFGMNFDSREKYGNVIFPPICCSRSSASLGDHHRSGRDPSMIGKTM